MKIVTALGMIALAACTPVELRGNGGGVCDAAKATDLVGKPFTDALGKAALRRTGSRTLRHLPPGTAATMDYRQDRLTIMTDANGVVTGINCG